MQDAITSVINAADVQGKYLDDSSVEKLKSYFKTGELRVRAAATIAANAATIIKESVAKSLLYSDILVLVEICIQLADMQHVLEI